MSSNDGRRQKVRSLFNGKSQGALIDVDPTGNGGSNVKTLGHFVDRVEFDIVVREAKRGVKKTDLAWLAGIIDGEGCIGMLQFQRTWQVRVQIANTNYDIIQKVVDIYEAICRCDATVTFRHRRVQKRSHDTWKPRFDWYTTSRQALLVLKVVEQYLVGKKSQARLAIAFQERVSFDCGKNLDEREWAYREGVKAEFHRLNAKGQKKEVVS